MSATSQSPASGDPASGDPVEGPANEGPAQDAPLADGGYDVFVVDAHSSEAAGDVPAGVIAEVTMLDGKAKGMVLSVGCAPGELLPVDGDPIDLLGETGVLTVTNGDPKLQLDC